jgi:hypothetical protein
MKGFGLTMGILIASAVAITGCTAANDAQKIPKADGRSSTTGSPLGWESEFEQASRHATTEFEREALADGRISDAEFAEMENSFVDCLRERNVSFGGFGPAGGYGFTPGTGTTTGEANSIADECSASSGLNTVGYLYFAMKRNPQNLDEATITAACLVEKKVVPQTYTASDYARDTPTRAYPFTDAARGEKAMEECDTDPLGLLDGQKR